MNKIKKIHAREILDSRGNPTVEAEITLDNNDLFSGKDKDVWLAKEIRESISKWLKEERI